MPRCRTQLDYWPTVIALSVINIVIPSEGIDLRQCHCAQALTITVLFVGRVTIESILTSCPSVVFVMTHSKSPIGELTIQLTLESCIGGITIVTTIYDIIRGIRHEIA
jgi:hypothetical protein